jgi:hypothetical protein
MSRRLLLLVLPIIVAFGAYRTARDYRSHVWGGPVIEVPSDLDLGTMEVGRVEVPFTIRNTGCEPLRLDRIQPTCGCMAVSLSDDPERRPVANLTVPAGDAVHLIGILSLQGPSGSFATTIHLVTNDPERPEVTVRITAHIAGSIIASPSHWLLGDLTDARPIMSRVELRDGGRRTPCRIDRVLSDRPDLVRVTRFHNWTTDRLDPDRVSENSAALLGTIHLELTPPVVPGEFSANIIILSAESANALLTIPVSGRLLPAVQLSPSTVILPRHSAGKPIDLCSLVAKSPIGQVFSLRVVDSAGLHVSLPRGSAVSHTLEVGWPASARPAPGQSATKTVRFAAEFSDRSLPLSLPVTYRSPEG